MGIIILVLFFVIIVVIVVVIILFIVVEVVTVIVVIVFVVILAIVIIVVVIVFAAVFVLFLVIVVGVFFVFLVESGCAGRGKECVVDVKRRSVEHTAAGRVFRVRDQGSEEGEVDVLALDVVALGNHIDVSLVQKVYWGRMQQTKKGESENQIFMSLAVSRFDCQMQAGGAMRAPPACGQTRLSGGKDNALFQNVQRDVGLLAVEHERGAEPDARCAAAEDQ